MKTELYSTGQVARELGMTEPQLNNCIRRGYITVAPGMMGGRRLWTRANIDSARLDLRQHAAVRARKARGDEPKP